MLSCTPIPARPGYVGSICTVLAISRLLEEDMLRASSALAFCLFLGSLPAAEALEPSFDCAAAAAPPAELICASAERSSIHLAYVQASDNGDTVARYPPKASESSGDQLRSEMISIAETLRLSRTAYFCGLRSDEWFGVMSDGLTSGIDPEIDRLRALSPDANAFSGYVRVVMIWLKKYSLPPSPTQDECRALASSPTMGRLDETERKLSGHSQ